MFVASWSSESMAGNNPHGSPPRRPPPPDVPAGSGEGKESAKPQVAPRLPGPVVKPGPAAERPAVPRKAPPPHPALRAAAAKSRREPATLPDSKKPPSTTHERVKQTYDPEPTSDVMPMLSMPLPGKDADKYIGCTIDGRYVVESVLGEGGMGVVYKCRRRIFEKTVAVKILRSDLARNQEAIDRFVTEAKAATAIGNAHIVDVLDFGELPDGSTYIAMEYLDGATLGGLIAAGALLDSQRVVAIGRQIADGLAAAHNARIVHRDLKPDNVFITHQAGRDFVKILDFGIAKVTGVQNKITRAGAVFGTPHYMSPEQSRGSPVDHRTDIYSLGVILYEMAAGRVPFDADNPLSILSMHLNEPPPSIPDVAPSAKMLPGLERVILKCLAKSPAERFETMAEVSQALSAIERGETLEIEVPISVAPPTDARAEVLASLQLPPVASVPIAPALEPPASAPSGPRQPLPSSQPGVAGRPSWPKPPGDLDEPSYIADVRSSLSDLEPPSAPRISAPPASVPPPSRRPPETAIDRELAAAAFDQKQLEREWASVRRRRRWPFVVLAIVLLGAAAALAAVLAEPSSATLAQSVQAGRPLVFGIRRPVAPPPVIDGKKVALVLAPIDAHVFQAGRDLGAMPIDVIVKKGEKVEIEIRREGYWTRKAVIDGSKSKETFRLAPIPGRKAPPIQAPPGLNAAGEGGEKPPAPEKPEAPPPPPAEAPAAE